MFFLSFSLEPETVKVSSGDDDLSLSVSCLSVEGHVSWVSFLGELSGGCGNLDIGGSPLLALGALVEGAPLVATSFTRSESSWLGAVLHAGSLGVTGTSLTIFGKDVLLRDGASLVGLDGGLEGPSDHLDGGCIDLLGLNNWEVGEFRESLLSAGGKVLGTLLHAGRW